MIGRKEELEFLIRKAESPHFEFGIVYGQRRIGKTTILAELVKKTNAFRYQAIAAESGENLMLFSRQLRAFLRKDDGASYPDYDAALKDIVREGRKRKVTFIIDELPYLAKGSPYLLSLLQDYCDHGFREANITFIISGSDEEFMEKLLLHKTSPLYKRNTFQMKIERLPLSDALLFLKGRSPEEKAQFISVFSTRPYYLAMINQGETFEENLQRMLYQRFATLLDAPDDVLPRGLSGSLLYNSILSLVAKKFTKQKDIAQKLKLDSNYISSYIRKLTEIGALEKKETFSQGVKGNYYALGDQLLAFYYRFIFPNREYIRLGGGNALYQEQKDAIQSDFIPHGFERMCNDYLTEQNLTGKLGLPYELFKGYHVEHSKLDRSIEIDGLARGLGSYQDHLIVEEAKYRDKDVSLNVYEHLKESVSVFRGYSVIDYYIFSKKGFTEELKNLKDPHLHLITLKEMVEENNHKETEVM